jgi:hypothetical protein
MPLPEDEAFRTDDESKSKQIISEADRLAWLETAERILNEQENKPEGRCMTCSTPVSKQPGFVRMGIITLPCPNCGPMY